MYILTQFFCLFQEYLDIPVSVKLTRQPQSKRNVRSSAPAVTDIQPDIVQLGNFFAMKSESEEGLLVVQCTQILENQFKGLVLKKLSDESIHVLYKLSGMPSLLIEQFSNNIEGGGNR